MSENSKQVNFGASFELFRGDKHGSDLSKTTKILCPITL